MTLTLDESLDLARSFAAHIRDPLHSQKPPGIPEARMKVYRSLFFSSMTGFLDDTYKHLQRLLDVEWQVWQRRFFAQYQAQSPYFHRISSEFLQFIQTTPDFPRPLAALAQYEQHAFDVEVLASSAETEKQLHLLSEKVLSPADILCLNSRLQLEGFEYDITKMLAAESWDDTLGVKLSTPVFFVFYRNKREKLSIKILAPVTVALLSLFEKPNTPEAALNTLAESMQLELASIQKFGFDFMQEAIGDMLCYVQHH